MKKSTKAALLSGLIFPGVGHLYLGSRLRGYMLLALALVALWVSATVTYESAQQVAGKILSGEVPAESGAIERAISDATSATDSLESSIATVVLMACWLAGIMDSYRLGAAQEK